jgi:hypothetical protein
VLGGWSCGGVALTEAVSNGTAACVTGAWHCEPLDRVGHWMPLRRRSGSALLLAFLRAHPANQ